jgi:uncharacterized protein
MSKGSEIVFGKVFEGKNSVLFDGGPYFILYEKLSNTIHTGSKEKLSSLMEDIESITYNARFSSRKILERKGALEGLVLGVTEDCNFRCGYCIYSGNYQGERRHSNNRMNFDIAKKALDFFLPRSEDPALISFYGGEPSKEIELIKKVVDYSKRFTLKKKIFSMTTNFFDVESFLEFFVKENFYLNVSLDGPQEIHDSFRRDAKGNPTWNKIMLNLEALERISPGYVGNHVTFTSTCADPKNFLQIADYFLERDYMKLIKIGGVEQKGLKKELGTVKPKQMINLANRYLDLIINEIKTNDLFRILFDKKIKDLIVRGNEEIPEFLELNGSCYPGKRKLFVDPKGDFYMCEKFGKRLPIGTVEEGISEDKVQKAIENFKGIRNNLCTDNCWAQRICTPCIHSAKDSNKDISSKGLKEFCNPSKYEILISLAMYSRILREKEIFINEAYIKELKQEESNERTI